MSRISIIGTGYVGLVSAACFAEIGHTCICVDVDEQKVDRINSGRAPIHEEGLDALVEAHAGHAMFATTDLEAAVRDTDITFIAVGTPFDGRSIDLSFIRGAALQIGAALKIKAGYHVVVVKSTVVPGTSEDVVLPLVEQASGKRAGADFGIAMNPEFLTEGTAIYDFMEPDRIVIGGIDERSIAALRDVYARFVDVPIVETNPKTAEMIKYASNCMLATMISFANEIGNACQELGNIDVAEVMSGVHLARYFSGTGEGGRQAPAPITSFLWAGCGYGGSCLPKDTKALSAHVGQHGMEMPLLDAVIATNRGQPMRLISTVMEHFPVLSGVRVSVLGLAFKQDTDDVRETPAIPLILELLVQGAKLTAYDPIAMEQARAALGANSGDIDFASSLEEAVSTADVVIVVTRWGEFRGIPEIVSRLATPPLVVDGRRMLDRTSVPRYAGIGYRPGTRSDERTSSDASPNRLAAKAAAF